MKKTVLILNWLTIISIVITPIVSIILVVNSIQKELPDGGADGPTAVFISTRINPILIIIPLLIVLVLMMNILLIRKQEKQIANQRVDLTRPERSADNFTE